MPYDNIYNCIVLYCFVLYCVVLYCIVLYCILFYCIVLYCIVLYFIVLYCIVLYCIVLYCILLYCIVLYCIVLYCIVLFCIINASTHVPHKRSMHPPELTILLGKDLKLYEETFSPSSYSSSSCNITLDQIEFWMANRNLVLAFGLVEDGDSILFVHVTMTCQYSLPVFTLRGHPPPPHPPD